MPIFDANMQTIFSKSVLTCHHMYKFTTIKKIKGNSFPYFQVLLRNLFSLYIN